MVILSMRQINKITNSIPAVINSSIKKRPIKDVIYREVHIQ